jgi:hypothetical protein
VCSSLTEKYPAHPSAITVWFRHSDMSHERSLLLLGEMGPARKENAPIRSPIPVTVSNEHILKSTVPQIAVDNLASAAMNGRINAIERERDRRSPERAKQHRGPCKRKCQIASRRAVRRKSDS